MALVRDDGSRAPTRREDPSGADPQNVPTGWRGVLWTGYAILVVFFGGFGAWAAFAPLGSGAIAQGQVDVFGNQKIVQHLEGGIIRELRVAEGDAVEAGQVLLILDDTGAQVALDRLRQRHLALLGQEARLIAERDGLDIVAFPAALMARNDDPDVFAIIDGQQRLLDGRRDALASQQGLLDRRIAKSREEITALKAQQRADRRQLAIIEEEISGVRELFEKGLERKPRLLALQRTQANLEGSIENHGALTARAEQTIAEIEFQRLALVDQNRADVESELRETQTQAQDLREQLVSARDQLERTAIRAPRTGRVYGLRFHTIGGVIGPGEPILNIVPDDEELIVTARLEPIDIDVVEIGAATTVRLTAYNQRTAKPIDGKVVHISPDVVQPQQGPAYYEARIRLSPSMMREYDIDLVPGMPAMAIISTGDQTLLDYLVSPLTRSLDTAFREQ